VSVAGVSDEAENNLPTVSLLTCTSTAPTFNASQQDGLLLFSTVGCPPGFDLVVDVAGRMVVALPAGGEAGAQFGGPSLPPSGAFSPNHTHAFAGQFAAPAAGVGLASGCCGDGYAAAAKYPFQGASAPASLDVPYAMLPLCRRADARRE
jgi:hypothetical protein